MATDNNDVTRLRAEIANLEFAARCFREAANSMQAQRDEARQEARSLRHWIHIAALVIAVTVLLVVGAVARSEAAEAAEAARMQQLVRIDRAAAETVALQAVVPSTAQSTELNYGNGYIVYEVVVAGKDGQTHEVTVDAGNARILQLETGEKEFNENNDQDLILGLSTFGDDLPGVAFPLNTIPRQWLCVATFTST